MMDCVEISVIVPVYNREGVLGKCLDSILNQSYGKWECIVVDDGSTDGTFGVCEEYARKDKRFVIYRQENKGVSAARNKGLDHASGAYIAFVDSDDDVDPDYLQKLLEAIKGHDLSMGGKILYKKKKTSYYNYQQKTIMLDRRYEEDYLNMDNLYLFNGPVCKLFRRKIIEENRVRFPVGISYGEDAVFNYTYFLYTQSIRIISDNLYHINQTSESLSDLKARVYPFESHLAVWNAKALLLKSKGMDGPLVSARILFLYCSACWMGAVYVLSMHNTLSFAGRYNFLKDIIAKIDRGIVNSASGYSPWRRWLLLHPVPVFLFLELKYKIKKRKG